VKNSIDIACRLGEVTLNDWVSRPLFQSALVLCAAPGLIPQGQSLEHPSHLASQPVVCLKRIPVWRFARGSEQTVFVPKPCFCTDEIRFAVDAVREGFGFSCLPEYLVGDMIKRGELVRHLPDWDSGGRPVNMIYPHRHSLPVKTRTFIDFIMAYFRQEPIAA
jgi:LysR family transcriptional regulator, transcriptional activator AphB